MEMTLSAASGWPASALLTAAMVFGLQRLASMRGGRVAGLVASAPLTSAPALLWLAHVRGSLDAAAAAIAGLQLTGVVATVLLVLLVCAPRHWLVAARQGPVFTMSGARADAWSALCAGAVTGACLAAGSWLSAAAFGVLACLPWTSACAFACALRCQGPVGATAFLLGYAQGLAPRLVFFGGIGLLLPALGGPAAAFVAVALAGATYLAQRSAAGLIDRRGKPLHRPSDSCGVPGPPPPDLRGSRPPRFERNPNAADRPVPETYLPRS